MVIDLVQNTVFWKCVCTYFLTWWEINCCTVLLFMIATSLRFCCGFTVWIYRWVESSPGGIGEICQEFQCWKSCFLFACSQLSWVSEAGTLIHVVNPLTDKLCITFVVSMTIVIIYNLRLHEIMIINECRFTWHRSWNYKVTLEFENSHMECLVPKERWKGSDLRWSQSSCSNMDVLTSSSKLFQTAGAATAWSLMVECWVRRPTSAEVAAILSIYLEISWLASRGTCWIIWAATCCVCRLEHCTPLCFFNVEPLFNCISVHFCGLVLFNSYSEWIWGLFVIVAKLAETVCTSAWLVWHWHHADW